MHSQRLRNTPLKPWLIADKQGKILCGHCDCVAGLGETCTHVAALLFYVETKVRIRDSSTVTQEAAYWKLPTTTTNVVYSRACDMDFTSAKTKKRKLDALVNADETLLDKTPGFVFHPDFPFIGASPDGLVSCDCFGSGLVEIKCPFCARDTSVADYCDSALHSCLSRDPDVTDSSDIKLRRDHHYMYQIHTQLHVCDVEFVDFVVWTQNDIHIERIQSDRDMWQDICEQSEEFFKKAILPELLGKWYSKAITETTVFSQTCNSLSNEIKYCYSKEPEDKDDMIACDNENCPITWFHIGCLKIKKIPKVKFYCPDCRKEFTRCRGKKKL